MAFNASSSTEPLRQELGAFLVSPSAATPPALPVSIHFRRRIRKDGLPAITGEFKQIMQQVETELPGREVGYTLRRSHIGGYMHLLMEGDAAFVNRFIELATAAGWRPYGNIAISEVIAVRPIPRHGEEEFPAENYSVHGHSSTARKREEGSATPVEGVDEMTAAVYRREQSARLYGGLPYATTAAAVRGAKMAARESPNVGESPPRVLGESNVNYARRKSVVQAAEEMLRRSEAAGQAYVRVGGRRRSVKAGKKAQAHRKTQKRRAK